VIAHYAVGVSHSLSFEFPSLHLVVIPLAPKTISLKTLVENCSFHVRAARTRNCCLDRFVATELPSGPLFVTCMILKFFATRFPEKVSGRNEGMTPIKTTVKISGYIVSSGAAALLLLTAQVSLAASATWLSSPQDSAWENANNWTPGGPPNGPSDIATFAQSSQRDVNVSTSEEVNRNVFASDSVSFTFNISPDGAFGGELIISGVGVANNNSVLQTFLVRNGGQLVFNNASTAASAHMSICNGCLANSGEDSTGDTIFNDTSSAAGASIGNESASGFDGDIGRTTFNGASTADHASISNYGAEGSHGVGGETNFNDTSTAANASIDNFGSGPASTAGSALTIFNDASTAGHAIITSHGGDFAGGTIFNDSSTGGTARLKVIDNG
jgi:hypothetical protein